MTGGSVPNAVAASELSYTSEYTKRVTIALNIDEKTPENACQRLSWPHPILKPCNQMPVVIPVYIALATQADIVDSLLVIAAGR